MGMTMIPNGSGGFIHIPTSDAPRQPDFFNCPKCEGEILQFTCPCCQKTIQVDDIEEQSDDGMPPWGMLLVALGAVFLLLVLICAGVEMSISNDPNATFFGEVWKILVSIGTFFTRLW